MRSFCSAKASLIFSTKNISVFGYKVLKQLTSWPLNELVKLTCFEQLGPCLYFYYPYLQMVSTLILKVWWPLWQFKSFCSSMYSINRVQTYDQIYSINRPMIRCLYWAYHGKNYSFIRWLHVQEKQNLLQYSVLPLFKKKRKEFVPRGANSFL